MLFLKQVWWPLFYHFKYLHPEYEVDDFKDVKRYLNFAYIRPAIRICFEVDGYGPQADGNFPTILNAKTSWRLADGL